MRKLKILSIITVISCFILSLNGQNRITNINSDSTNLISTNGKIVEIVSSQKFHLNSKGKTVLSGKNRITLEIELPENTKEWYFYICAIGEGSARNIQLASQIGVLMMKKFARVSQIQVENGNSYCNVYVLPDQVNSSNFENNSKFKYFESSSRLNFSSGVVKCPVLSKKVWLGIENDRKIHAVDITVEVVAIVNNN